MGLKDIGHALKKVAPLLAAVVGGPLGGGAAAIVSHALGVNADDHEALAVAVADPANEIKLRELEHTHREELERLALRDTELRLADTKDARSREVEITKATGKRDLNLYILAWVITIGFFAITGFLCVKEVPPGSVGPVGILFGALTAAFAGVVGYFFGSSAGSKEKTDILAEQARKTDVV